MQVGFKQVQRVVISVISLNFENVFTISMIFLSLYLSLSLSLYLSVRIFCYLQDLLANREDSFQVKDLLDGQKLSSVHTICSCNKIKNFTWHFSPECVQHKRHSHSLQPQIYLHGIITSSLLARARGSIFRDLKFFLFQRITTLILRGLFLICQFFGILIQLQTQLGLLQEQREKCKTLACYR